MTRQTVAVGRRKGEQTELSVRCQWCGKWMDGEPEDGARISHGICTECQEIHFPGLNDE